MKLHKLYLTENDCYKRGKYITPKGVMVHSTGANNPWLKRYVGPDDGLLGKNQYNNHWNQPTGAHDAYNTGDIVNYNGTLYKSLIDGNVWAPDAYPAGWEVYEA